MISARKRIAVGDYKRALAAQHARQK